MTNRKAFLDMLAWSEIGPALLAESDNGYNVLVGSTPAHPLLFNSYAHHPHVINHALNSSAAGRYQIIYPTYFNLCHMLGVSDFEPDTQDNMAIQLISGRGALEDVDLGNFADAVAKCAAEWASLPGGTSGQPSHSLADLEKIYISMGGELA